MMLRLILVTLCLCSLTLAHPLSRLVPARLTGDRQTYDHQNTTYHAHFSPESVSQGDLKITPFFSPDHANDVLSQFVEGAEETLDVGIPSFSSWSGCTNYYTSPPWGCEVAEQRNNESFPVFPALLNALHRGVKVRLLTNYYNGEAPSPGKIAPLEFLQLAGADVRYFTTVTFLHTKYLQADKKRASVSSINFSHTSIMKNREAAMLIEGEDSGPLMDWLTSVFEADYNQAVPYPVKNHYSDAEMAIIRNKSVLPVPAPTPYPFPGAYVSPLKSFTGTMDSEIYASPDDSFEVLMDAMDSVQHSFGLFIYQVDNDGLCKKIHSLASSGVEIKMLVSHNIFSEPDWEASVKCYDWLADNGVVFKKTEKMFSYSHCKFWILDDEVVQMSTGNWAPTDYPDRSTKGPDYPPYGDKNWTKCNRDYTVSVKHPGVAGVFQKVLDEDYTRGEIWNPNTH